MRIHAAARAFCWLAIAAATLFTDGRYRTQAKEEVTGAKIVIGRKGSLVAAGEWLAGAGIRRAARPCSGSKVESMSVAMQATACRLAEVEGQDAASAPPLVERARMVKDAEEIRLIRQRG